MPNPGFNEPALPPGLRAFDDAPTVRKSIYDGVLESLGKRFPVADGKHRLELTNLRYASPQDFPLSAQKKAIMANRNLATQLVGKWRLVDEVTGGVLDEKEDTVMHVPYYTDRGTVINRGSEYSITSQARLKPGVYTRTKKSGEHEAHFNILPGSGKTFRLWMEPATGIFRVNVGQANIPAYQFFSTMGIPDADMQKAWGQELFQANRAKVDRQATAKLYERFAGNQANPAANEQEMAEYLRTTVPKYAVNEEVVARTMGLPKTTTVTPQLLLRTTQKLLNISRGEEEEDNREAPQFSDYYSPDDFIKERIDKDAGHVTRNLLFRIRRDGNLKRLGHAPLNSYIQSLILGSGLASTLEETNPLQTLDQQHRIIKLGEGGISSAETVIDEARDVHAGQAGFIDPVSGPECYSCDTRVLTEFGFKYWTDVTEGDKLACRVGGSLEFCKPERLIVADYDGDMLRVRGKFLDQLVTPNHRCWTRTSESGSKFRFELAQKLARGRNFLVKPPPWIGPESDPPFVLPAVERRPTALACGRLIQFGEIPLVLWAKFMGFYLSEGNNQYFPEKVMYHTRITQGACHPDVRAEIESTLNAIGFRWTLQKDDYHIAFKQLALYLSQFGGSYDKFIPEYLLRASLPTRQALFDALMMGDGKKTKNHRAYCSTSHRLAVDFQRLAISLGYSTNFRMEYDKRHLGYAVWYVSLPDVAERAAQLRTSYSRIRYIGKVYCATVPGGLLYVQRGHGQPMWSGNSEKCGIDMRAAYRTFKGPNKQIYGEFSDPNGKPIYMTPMEAADKTLAFPGQSQATPEVYAIKNGKIDRVPTDEVDAWIPSNSHMYSPTVNVTPMGTGFMPSRAFFSSKYQTQFLPVVGGEAPLVQAAVPDGSGRSFSEYYGRKVGCLNSQVAGIVTKVTDDGVSITDKDGKKHFVELTKDMPFNRMTSMSYRAAVKEGDLVKPGDLLAASNFTDDQGNLAMGRNLKTAVLPSRGWSFEDAMVISESAAKKLTTERLYAIDKEARHGVQISRNRFISAFPAKYTKDQIANMDENGVAQVGTVVNKGDPIVLAVGPKALSTADAELGRLHKALRNAFRDEALEWEYSTPGIVTDVGRTTTGVKVNVKAQSPVQVGDKLTTAGASKGVTGLIVSDDEMPKDNETGEPYEMLLNPMVVLSRVAPNQLVELQLAKVAKKTGKPYILPDTPPEEGWVEFAKRELEKNGLQPTKDIYDPITGRLVPSVGDGYMYISAFHHLAEKKLCVSEDTEVLTWRGWLPASAVLATDLLATLNPFTGETEYRPITHRAEYQIRHPERLIRVTGNDRDELVTDEHPVYIDGKLVLAKALLELVPCP